jgi:hypothetical protein
MRKLMIFIILLAFSSSVPKQALAQDLSSIEREKLRQAENAADSFVERSRQSLDLGAVWEGFQMSDISCTIAVRLAKAMPDNSFTPERQKCSFHQELECWI